MLYVTHSPAEAIALGSRLFLLEQGRIVAQGPPLEVLGTARADRPDRSHWEGIRNVFPARPSPVTHQSKVRRSSRSTMPPSWSSRFWTLFQVRGC